MTPEAENDEPPPSGLLLDLDEASNEAGIPAADDFRRWVTAALAGAGLDPEDDNELSIRVVPETESRQLNHQWRGRDRATNVLSFPGESLPGMPWRHLGDLVICAAVVAREATEQSKPLDAHWAHMVVHGTLHLLGHDHQSDPEAEAMEALEQRILAGLGYPDPYTISE